MIQVARPYFRNKEAILEDIAAVLESGRLMNGEMTRSFETSFARYIGSKYAISVNSCTTALEIVLRFYGIQEGEVIIPANTFIATGNAVLFAGGNAILADCRDDSYNIDIDEIQRKITKKTRGVIVVHIAGIVCEDIDKIRGLCQEHNLFLIEDCAHASGAELNGKRAGSFGNAGCFSFYPTKVMTTGAGGMITTDDEELDAFARSLRVHGSSPKGTSEIVNMGNDWFMDEIRAAIGLHQLQDINYQLTKRREIASWYTDKIQAIRRISIFPISEFSSPAYYKFPVQLHPDVPGAIFKEQFAKKYHVELESLYWPPCHLQPLYQKLFHYKEGDFPISERILRQQICLPIHAFITREDVDTVAEGLEVLL
nr:DegT/DnrJ/EryC1/StrS family aminotransferase [uncultured Methanoregula sp.]